LAGRNEAFPAKVNSVGVRKQAGRRGPMCEAHAFILQDEREVKLLESVDELEVEGDEIRLINIFGEQKILKARVKGYSGSGRKILLEPIR
jgi:predicted RNA-binding protein